MGAVSVRALALTARLAARFSSAMFGPAASRHHGIEVERTVNLDTHMRRDFIVPPGQRAVYADPRSRAVPTWVGSQKPRLA